MKINFTKEQYKTLLKIVYMGNGIVNAVDESEDNEFTAMEEYIFSFAKNVGLEHLVEYDETEKIYYPSEKLEEDEEIIEYIQSYDDNIFWEKLIFNLARRDMENEYGRKPVEKMSEEESFVKGQPFAQKYEKEFSKNGLKNLKI
ncbi:MAG: hypothetical protein NT178_05145 [Proteobacteria bacterium]|nr:hypothetical protein [Pseudomonadota bacterium]